MKSKKEKLRKYEKYLNSKAKKFKLTAEDLSNLTDLGLMIPYWFVEGVLKPSKMKDWYIDFFDRIEKITLRDIK